MASSEDRAYEIMRELDVNYVLVIFGGLTGYASDGEYYLQDAKQLMVAWKVTIACVQIPPSPQVKLEEEGWGLYTG